MTEDVGSTVPRRQLGRALRELRTEARITLDGAAGALQCSRQKLWRIEYGLGPIRAADVRALCDLYETTPELTGALVAVAAETKAKGWWHSYGDAIPDWFEPFLALEQAANRHREFADTLVPGLLQTRSYALGRFQNRPAVTEEELERLVQVRMQRQELLVRRLPPPPRLEVILTESALLRTVVNAATMADQLRHLLILTERPTVSIRVLPLVAAMHQGAVAGSFVLLDFPPGKRIEAEPSVVYQESLTGALYLDRPAEYAAYEEVWASLAALALDEGQSKLLINKIIGKVYHG